MSVEHDSTKNYEFFYDRKFGNEILKVSGTLVSTKFKELTSSDNLVCEASALYNNFIESLILAQDERWRRA